MASSRSTTTQTAELLRSALVWDNHCCLPLRADLSFLPQLNRYKAAGATVASINVGYAEMSWEEHLKVLSFMRRWIASQSGMRLVSTIEDVRRCKAEAVLGVVFDVEGMYPVLEDISFVQTFYELGVRWMSIAYNRNNGAGGGCLDSDGGLTDKGRRVIEEMNRVGMVLCLSHTGARTAADALECSSQPAIFSHSNPYGCHAHARNVSDQLIRSCARKGGVIGISGIGPYLGATQDLVAHLLRHVLYLIDLVGAEHVGLGLDYVFDTAELNEHVRLHPQTYPADIISAGRLAMIEPEAVPEIIEGLLRERLPEAQIRGILGENWLRVATQVWRHPQL